MSIVVIVSSLCVAVLVTLNAYTDNAIEGSQSKDLRQSINRGHLVYEDFCVVCHQSNGEGVPSTFPPLANSDYLLKNREASIQAVKYGQSGEITVNGEIYNNFMGAPGLSDQEVVDVMNYILNSWGNKNEKMVTLEEVQSIQKK